MAIVAAAIFSFTRPLPPPRVTAIVQLTFDGKSKSSPLLTDGSRLYFNSISAGGAVPTDYQTYQVSAKGGEPWLSRPRWKGRCYKTPLPNGRISC